MQKLWFEVKLVTETANFIRTHLLPSRTTFVPFNLVRHSIQKLFDIQVLSKFSEHFIQVMNKDTPFIGVTISDITWNRSIKNQNVFPSRNSIRTFRVFNHRCINLVTISAICTCPLIQRFSATTLEDKPFWFSFKVWAVFIVESCHNFFIAKLKEKSQFLQHSRNQKQFHF